MSRRIPVAEDLTSDDKAALVLGRHDEVALRLQLSRSQLARLIADDKSTREMILAARAEFQAYLEMRVLMLSVDALDTLDRAMHEKFADPKAATAGVRAAESILDRGSLPKLTRSVPLQGGTKRDDRLPDLGELVKRAENDSKAHELVDAYMDTIRRIEAMKRGATQIVDGDTVEVQPEGEIISPDASNSQQL